MATGARKVLIRRQYEIFVSFSDTRRVLVMFALSFLRGAKRFFRVPFVAPKVPAASALSYDIIRQDVRN